MKRTAAICVAIVLSLVSSVYAIYERFGLVATQDNRILLSGRI